MNLSKLTHEVWKKGKEQGLNIPKNDVSKLIKIIINEIKDNLFKYGVLKIHNLFTLSIKENKGRRIFNLKTKSHMQIDDYYKISIKPSKDISDRLKKYK